MRELQRYVDRAPRGTDTSATLKMIADPRRTRKNFAPDFSITTKQGEFLTLEDP